MFSMQFITWKNNIYIEPIAYGSDWRLDRADKAAPRPTSVALLMMRFARPRQPASFSDLAM